MRALDNNTLPLPFALRTAEELAEELTTRTGSRIRLTVTKNRSSMVTFRWEHGDVVLRLHRHFLTADDTIITSLVLWIKHPRRGTPDDIRAFIRDIPDEQRPASVRIRINPEGHHHDLRSVAERVNQQFFSGRLDLSITWGLDNHRRSVRRRRLGSYYHDNKLVVVHPVLDDKRVPERVLAYIIYHEMLHSEQPREQLRPHDKAFREAERAYPYYEECENWLKENVRLIHTGNRKRLNRTT